MSVAPHDRATARAIADAAHRLVGAPDDFGPVLDAVGDARFVLLGEASHGTHEFYRIRAALTKRLIRECGFVGVAVEADWPDAFRVDRYVRALGEDADAGEALAGFTRFPQWMWRNADVLDFVGWLRAHNESLADPAQAVGFYGLDLYSLHASMEAVVRYLDAVDPDAARRARARYACFDHFGGDPQAYGHAAGLHLDRSCEDDVVAQLVELRRAAATHAERAGRHDPDATFAAERNARLVVAAEHYYREMFRSRVGSWNLRDTHMTETLEALAQHLDARTGRRARLVVWAHNSHLGDARATEPGEQGEHNVGQLVRMRHGRDAALVGFTTCTGTVTAAHDWDAPAERMRVRHARADSYEGLFHAAVGGDFVLRLDTEHEVVDALGPARLERAIGVIYRPGTERLSHYFHASLPRQFDVVLHYDTTRAVEPLERTARWAAGAPELPETYPSAL